MFKVLIPAAAALGLIAFAAQSEDRNAELALVEMTTPVMGWSVHQEGDLAKLAYGVANSDQLALMVTCQPGDRTAVVYGDVQPEGAQLMRAAYDPLSGGDAEETRIGLGDPNLNNLAERGRMQVRGDAGVFQLAATRDERRIVSDFLAYCSPERA